MAIPAPEQGFDAVQSKAVVDAAVRNWLVMAGRLDPDAPIVGLEIRAWKTNL